MSQMTMGVLTDSIALDIVLAVTITIFLIMNYYMKIYWKTRGVPFVKPQLFFGNFKQNLLGQSSVLETHETIYKELKGERFGGYFEMHIPSLMILDPNLINKILVKDFRHFHDRGLVRVDEENDPLTNNLANLEGHQWHNLRNKLSPAFNTAALKEMFNQICNCGEDLLKVLDKYAGTNEIIDAKDVMNIFTIDVITSCNLTLPFKVNSLEGQTFMEMVTNASPPARFIVVRRILSFYGKLLGVFGMRQFPKKVTDYFIQLIGGTIQHRERNNIEINDLLQILIKLKQNKMDPHKEVITDNLLAATSFLFLMAGFEVSRPMSFLLYNVATNPEVQRLLQQEVDEVLSSHGGYSYQAVKDMVYMDTVIQESLRLYPIGGFLTRVCTEPYQIPDSGVVLEKGTKVTIPLWALHRDPQHYPDPEHFKPERFINNAYKPSSTYLPFGNGPRMCIAMRFAILEMKICLAMMMSRYTISLSDKTKQPLRPDPHSMRLRPMGGVWITISRKK